MSASECIPMSVQLVNGSLKASNIKVEVYSTLSASDHLIIKHLWLRRNAFTIGSNIGRFQRH